MIVVPAVLYSFREIEQPKKGCMWDHIGTPPQPNNQAINKKSLLVYLICSSTSCTTITKLFILSTCLIRPLLLLRNRNES